MTPTDIQRLRALAEKANTHRGYAGNPWNNPDLPVVDMIVRREVSEAWYALIEATDPATVIALCDLAEKANPEPAQAQVSDAEVTMLRRLPQHCRSTNAVLRSRGTRTGEQPRLHSKPQPAPASPHRCRMGGHELAAD